MNAELRWREASTPPFDTRPAQAHNRGGRATAARLRYDVRASIMSAGGDSKASMAWAVGEC